MMQEFSNLLLFLDPKVINAIKWSRGLDRVFTDNYNRDPTLSWQYFGSSAGFMRQYPGEEMTAVCVVLQHTKILLCAFLMSSYEENHFKGSCSYCLIK